ncbi:hypothetical protein CALCODRAFT_443708 [Calocera cornea HHB12733]|uniref:Uncharacterized protein n=1 Tax=Calocera cornea HHB12733 TaxID=1353952 RepID=A0A165CLD6_9BASI|nr:hypothetical protein CALCODRAFT_443708 [Calocera cornea HHB12733]
MGGPNLELFKFAVYVFFPVAIMFHYGNPEWYEKHVLPMKDTFWPKEENTNKIPHDRATIRAELAKYKAERQAARRAQQQQVADAQPSTSADTPRLV